MYLKLFIVVFLCLFPFTAYPAIYSYVDEQGIQHFTNLIPAGKKYTIIIPNKTKRIIAQNASANHAYYDKLIYTHSNNHGVDPSLVKAVVKAESNFDPYAVSYKGAQGLMQLMPDTARLMRVNDPFDPDENIRGGAGYLKLLEEVFNGNLELMLAAYNAGPQRVFENNMKVPPIGETKDFIKRVKFYYQKFKKTNEG